MVYDRVVLELNDYEKKLYSSSAYEELRRALLEINARALLISRAVGKELLQEDTTVVEKFKAELAEATSCPSSALNINVELTHRNKELELESGAAKGEVSELKRIVEKLTTENNFLQERCTSVQEKERVVVLRIDVLSEEVVNLGQKMTMLTLDLEEEQSARVKVEKDLDELRGFVIKQHNLGFDRAVRQATFFY